MLLAVLGAAIIIDWKWQIKNSEYGPNITRQDICQTFTQAYFLKSRNLPDKMPSRDNLLQFTVSNIG